MVGLSVVVVEGTETCRSTFEDVDGCRNRGRRHHLGWRPQNSKKFKILRSHVSLAVIVSSRAVRSVVSIVYFRARQSFSLDYEIKTLFCIRLTNASLGIQK